MLELLSRLHVPLRWKLIVMLTGFVVLVSSAMVAAWIFTHGESALEQLRQEAGSDFVHIALLNAAFWTMLGAILAGIYVKRITEPLARIALAASAVEAGNLEVQVPVPIGDEMETFTIQFNGLVASLRAQRTQIQRLVEDLNRANANLAGDVRRSERLAALGTLSAGLAHELNNLLNSVMGYTSVMQSEIEPEHRFARDLAVIRHECQSAGELLARFLMFARPAALKPGPADLHALLESCLAVLSLPCQKQGIELYSHVDPTIPTLTCDAVLFEQALFNILLNAVQAMKKGGELAVEAEHAGSGRVRVTVADTGCGIEEANLSRIFDPFFTTKDPGEGTGLGLAISHRIVEQHGGTIHIDSRVGKGTRVSIELPVDSPKGGAA
ncbi:MAG: HAMP domain-containing protein [Candidatus Riflebacteria bacterium]|nr:HAMP domain-containing protein [Candidatus Riflebacteria bacterium]